MDKLPDIFNKEDAISFAKMNKSLSWPIKALIARILKKEKLKNKEIRELLEIDSIHKASHIIRCGMAFTYEQLSMCMLHKDRVSLGHARALTRVDYRKRNDYLKDIIKKRLSVNELVKYINGIIDKPEDTYNTDNYDDYTSMYVEKISNDLCAPVAINYFEGNKAGNLIIRFNSFEILDGIIERMGIDTSEL